MILSYSTCDIDNNKLDVEDFINMFSIVLPIDYVPVRPDIFVPCL